MSEASDRDDVVDQSVSEWEETLNGAMRRRNLPEEDGMNVAEIEFGPGKIIGLQFISGQRIEVQEGTVNYTEQPSRRMGVLVAGQKMNCNDPNMRALLIQVSEPARILLYYPKSIY